MLKRLPFLKGLLYVFFVFSFTLISFQNCAKTRFERLNTEASSLALPISPVCDLTKRLKDFENVACLSPHQNSLLALQAYTVICNENGSWSRQVRGPIDYSQCPKACSDSLRPSDVENVSCPAPFQSESNGLQRYRVICLDTGSWSRSTDGAADYSACSKVCDDAQRPADTSQVSCPAPYSQIISGVQRYTVTCNRDGSWTRLPTGSVDYGLCPQGCDQTKKPAATEPVKCPLTADIKAIQNFTITCEINGTWSRVPSTLDTSQCPAPTCDPNTKPPAQDQVACPAPYSGNILSKQNYTVSCSGTSWVRTPTTKDDSACPKTCGVQPANDFDNVACQAPFESTLKAKQNYFYICNSTTGKYDRSPMGGVDYGLCPKSCSGINPAVPQNISCPPGYTGTAVQNYSSTCDTTVGQWTTPVKTTLDTSGCRVATCSGAPPSNYDPAACQAPFQTRMDAKKMYADATCVSGSWVRGAATGVIDYSSCPVNDCTGSTNPGTEKDIGVCPSGATGRVYQTCSLVCTGNTYQQTNCSADNYSRCDCGADAVFNLTTRTCVPKSKLGECGTNFSVTLDGGSGVDTFLGVLVPGNTAIPTLVVRPGDDKDILNITMQQGLQAYKDFALQFSDGEQFYIGVYRARDAQIEEGFKCNSFITTKSSVADGKTYTYSPCTLDTDMISSKLAPGESMMFRAGAFSKRDMDQNLSSIRNFSSCVRVIRSATSPTFTYAWDPNAINRGSCSATTCGSTGTQSGTFTTCRRNDGVIVDNSYCGSNVAPAIACSAPACNYTYTTTNVQYGSCSATSCGTSGIRSVSSFQCQRNDGVIVSNSYCTTPVAQSCSSAACVSYSCQGSVPVSATMCAGDNQNLTSNLFNSLVKSCTAAKCEYTCNPGTVILNGSCQSCNSTNASAWYLEVNPDVKAAGMDALTHWCEYGKNEGRTSCFNDSQCPKLCAGGSTDVVSEPNNVGTRTTCSFSWNQVKAGQFAVVTRATNGGTLSALCSAAGLWENIQWSCPKPIDVNVAPKSCVRVKLDVHELAYNWPWVPQVRPVIPGTVYTREVSGYLRDVNNPSKYTRLFAASHSYNENNYLFAICEPGMTEAEMLEKSYLLNPNIYYHAKFWEDSGFVRGKSIATHPYHNADFMGNANLPNKICIDLGGVWSGNNSDFTLTTDGYLKIKCTYTVPVIEY